MDAFVIHDMVRIQIVTKILDENFGIRFVVDRSMERKSLSSYKKSDCDC